MPITDFLLPEFDQEMANTRKMLERVPDGRFGWKPHPKSWTMGTLATHVANLPQWTVETLNRDELDIAPVGQPPYKAEVAGSQKQLLEFFDANIASARKVLTSATDEEMVKPWKLLAGGKEIFTMPKIAVLRSFVMNHIIHHRAQLSVLLRLNDVDVPGMYGPSADEAQLQPPA
jgi:uncharacterized damage-inducible protein DinB